MRLSSKINRRRKSLRKINRIISFGWGCRLKNNRRRLLGLRSWRIKRIWGEERRGRDSECLKRRNRVKLITLLRRLLGQKQIKLLMRSSLAPIFYLHLNSWRRGRKDKRPRLTKRQKGSYWILRATSKGRCRTTMKKKRGKNSKQRMRIKNKTGRRKNKRDKRKRIGMATRKMIGRRTRKIRKKIAKIAIIKVTKRMKRKIPIHRVKVTTSKRNRNPTKTAQRKKTKTKWVRNRNRSHSKSHKKFHKLSSKQSSNK